MFSFSFIFAAMLFAIVLALCSPRRKRGLATSLAMLAVLLTMPIAADAQSCNCNQQSLVQQIVQPQYQVQQVVAPIIQPVYQQAVVAPLVQRVRVQQEQVQPQYVKQVQQIQVQRVIQPQYQRVRVQQEQVQRTVQPVVVQPVVVQQQREAVNVNVRSGLFGLGRANVVVR